MKLAHAVLEAASPSAQIADLAESLKGAASHWRLAWAEPREITKALEAARYQRQLWRGVRRV